RAGARTLPEPERISTRSPSSIEYAAAVLGLISTQLPHITVLIGSGNSWSHGKLASDPKPSAGCSYAKSVSGYSDSFVGPVAATSPVCLAAESVSRPLISPSAPSGG